MDETTLDSLEYKAVLKEVAGFASTSVGSASTLGLLPSSDPDEVRHGYAVCSELAGLLLVDGPLPLAGLTDISPYLDRNLKAGSYLLSEELLDVRANLIASASVRALLNTEFIRRYPLVSSIIETLSVQTPLKAELQRMLDEKGVIRDDASGELYQIRKEMRGAKDRARSILDSISRDESYSDILQEDIITIREDRYVLVVKADMHYRLKGVVHGRSGSGASFFVEPLQIIELNNRLSELKKEERSEEIRILKAATLMVMEQAAPLKSDIGVLAHLDSFQARARFAESIGGIVPELKEQGELSFNGARHPLLIIKELKGGPAAVPVDIKVGEEARVLVISGANTGGKTVALKTLGLLTLLVQSMIPVPMAEGSVAVIFESVYADIGDRQNIIESLSTFSAHIKRIKEFLSDAGAGSLVLMDEIGAGTDPAEGGAFALASLESFRLKGAAVAVTTHLNLLKAHAQTNPAYLNASVEFDERTLKPSYRLHYGVPGPSLGLAIAESLGIPAELVSRARGYLSEKEGAFIESVRKLEEEKAGLEKLRIRLKALEEQRSEAVERLRSDRQAYIAKSREKVEDVVRKAKESIRQEIQRLKEHKEVSVKAAGTKARSNVDAVARETLGKLGARKKPYTPAVGDRVRITGSATKGDVVSIDAEGRKAELAVGAMKVWAAWEKLEKIGGPARGRKTSPQGVGVTADIMEVGRTLNVIGMRVDEALKRLTRFLDSAHAAGLESVEIIHGVGTGALARGVHDYLATVPYVKSFHAGDPDRGGAGVTLVEFR